MRTSSVRIRTTVRRACLTLMLALALVFAWSSMAVAAPVVTNAKFSNPVAYELKSLLSTRFTCDVNTVSWGRLDIMGANGPVKTIYNGPLVAGTNWFPLWNGLDASGRRLPSASYDWRLTVTQGGTSTVVRGKITVSKIQFIIKGHAMNLTSDFHDRYMIPGNVNCYIQASTPVTEDAFSVGLHAPNDDAEVVGLYELQSGTTLKTTTYLRAGKAVYMRGIHTWEVFPANDITYYITVIQ